MTLSEWVERLRLMAVSTIVHIEPSECADLVRAIECETTSLRQQVSIRDRMIDEARGG